MIALLQARAAGLWSRSHIRNNVLAGLVVGIVALPLAMAFAIASGARPEQGLYTAIVAALLTSIFGGTRVQISGPTGAFVAVLAIITAQHGIAGPATGAIARTATNIRNGATSPLAGIVHSVFLILVILLLAPLASAIPLCCLAAVLFVVAWNMSELPHVVRLVRGAPT
jgi:MFS superfamily sulfate permease-like transporter